MPNKLYIFLAVSLLMIMNSCTLIQIREGSGLVNVESEEIGRVEEEFTQAFATVYEAEQAGAFPSEVNSLVDRLNYALDIIDKAKTVNGQRRLPEVAEMSTEALKTCVVVKEEAHALRKVASRIFFLHKLFVWMMVPLSAYIVTACVHFSMARAHARLSTFFFIVGLTALTVFGFYAAEIEPLSTFWQRVYIMVATGIVFIIAEFLVGEK